LYDKKKRDKLSKFMSYILRHNPAEFGLTHDFEGFVPLVEFISAVQKERQWEDINQEVIEQVVRECEKQRYEIVGANIRARYGHSKTNVSYHPSVPPNILYHGTNSKAISDILRTGVQPMNRQYVHLSETTKFASLAGKRRGELVLVVVDAQRAHNAGVKFYPAGGEVWLSEAIPPQFIKYRKLDQL
jgi:putative RNA 2'-phosphotransferase